MSKQKVYKNKRCVIVKSTTVLPGKPKPKKKEGINGGSVARLIKIEKVITSV